ncbi:hypothetical protein E3U36_03245 [Arsenophonus endosymbiont of Aphis craccivora]|uniref:hypothetical protein n=1 Tax=Arsenophonus endosymbiont of Aphis craccivora TaxID=1231049 RepID=UPI0015DC60D2|nr:hypothetical protein [Arsenophonus endosymbiont of Aphis craccivora]QLK87423.1 hypothetical protein E3U36_03245 [Arsenophonus endosymbiont of Aphis craccivora]
MPWGPDVETNLAISYANHLKVRFIQQSHDRDKSRIINRLWALLNKSELAARMAPSATAVIRS